MITTITISPEEWAVLTLALASRIKEVELISGIVTDPVLRAIYEHDTQVLRALLKRVRP